MYATHEHLVPITDHRNSIVGWWDASAEQLRNVIEYTPHGRLRVLAPDGTVLCTEEGTGADCQRQQELPPFGFASLLRANHTGLVYMRARWYAPRLGQFLSHDPLGAIDSHNLYAYAAMDPITMSEDFQCGTDASPWSWKYSRKATRTDRREAAVYFWDPYGLSSAVPHRRST